MKNLQLYSLSFVFCFGFSMKSVIPTLIVVSISQTASLTIALQKINRLVSDLVIFVSIKK